MSEAFLHYDQVASSYDQPQHHFFYSHLAEKLCILAQEHVQPEAILDVGCGTGISTVEIVKHFPGAEVTALDRSPSMLELARKKGDIRTVTFCYGHTKDLPVSEKRFDLIIANMSYHWLSPGDRRALRKALKENGVLVISFPLIMPFPKKEGNSLLLTIFRRLKEMQPAWHPFRGTRGLNWNEVVRSLPGLVPIRFERYCMEERFRRASDFLEVLRVRGVFFGFFGNKAAAAENIAGALLQEKEAISYAWPIGIAIFRREGPQKKQKTKQN
ncbi:MAG: class I SAM-dependent methyltransferase [Desulfovibrionales bacterium]|nr:class I SAM-dependent methyltransferase [Desulfovibrionales bacterium]